MRLIDADKIGLTDFEIVMCNGDYKKALKMLLDKISNQPTAYDVDKVVEELEKLNTFEQQQKDTVLCKKWDYGTIKRAIEIVKHGFSRTGDVCEWKYVSDGEFIKNPHTKRLYRF